jgi:2-polyprenyl-3-methyl-5-hydroxy-6-metoxy-1,4-benzoquinol methylase
MNEREFYDDLWRQKVRHGNPEVRQRDWVHRLILDRISDPNANDRTDVSARLLRGGQRILDLGIWGGDFLDRSDVKGRYTERHGLDLAAESVEAAKGRGIRAQVWNLNDTPYPFEAGHFDAVTILGVLEHLFDPISVMRELARLTRPGGQVVVSVPNVASLSNRVRVVLGRLPVTSLDPGWDGGHLHYFTIPETRRLMEAQGLQVSAVGISGGTQRLRLVWPSLLSGEFVLGGDKRG